VDLVVVAAALALAADRPDLLEVSDDSHRGPLGDADLLGDVTHPRIGIAGEA
jgi:hypothetical protein